MTDSVAFDSPEACAASASQGLDMEKVAWWVKETVEKYGVADTGKITWRTACGNVWADAWEKGPRIVVPAFRLEVRKIQKKGAQVFDMGTLLATRALKEGHEAPQEQPVEMRLDTDKDLLAATVSAFLKVVAGAAKKWLEREAKEVDAKAAEFMADPKALAAIAPKNDTAPIFHPSHAKE